MKEFNFCPFCDAPQHKLSMLDNSIAFCKSCNTFFTLTEIKYSCYKCGSDKFEDSDFPSPDGQLVIQCKKCKKMFSVTDFFKKNEKSV